MLANMRWQFVLGWIVATATVGRSVTIMGGDLCAVPDTCLTSSTPYFLSHPTDCTAYYQCNNKTPELQHCPGTLRFDHQQLSCQADARCTPCPYPTSLDISESLYSESSESPYSESPRSESPRSESPRSESPRSESPRSERPYGESPYGDFDNLPILLESLTESHSSLDSGSLVSTARSHVTTETTPALHHYMDASSPTMMANVETTKMDVFSHTTEIISTSHTLAETSVASTLPLTSAATTTGESSTLKLVFAESSTTQLSTAGLDIHPSSLTYDSTLSASTSIATTMSHSEVPSQITTVAEITPMDGVKSASSTAVVAIALCLLAAFLLLAVILIVVCFLKRRRQNNRNNFEKIENPQYKNELYDVPGDGTMDIRPTVDLTRYSMTAEGESSGKKKRAAPKAPVPAKPYMADEDLEAHEPLQLNKRNASSKEHLELATFGQKNNNDSDSEAADDDPQETDVNGDIKEPTEPSELAEPEQTDHPFSTFRETRKKKRAPIPDYDDKLNPFQDK